MHDKHGTILTRNVRINETRALRERSRRERVDTMRIELKRPKNMR